MPIFGRRFRSRHSPSSARTLHDGSGPFWSTPAPTVTLNSVIAPEAVRAVHSHDAPPSRWPDSDPGASRMTAGPTSVLRGRRYGLGGQEAPQADGEEEAPQVAAQDPRPASPSRQVEARRQHGRGRHGPARLAAAASRAVLADARDASATAYLPDRYALPACTAGLPVRKSGGPVIQYPPACVDRWHRLCGPSSSHGAEA